MDCREVIERLPWLVNGTLEPEERHAVEHHVAECTRCPAELRETRAMAALMDAHPSAEELLRLVEKSEAGPGLRAHVGECGACTAEVEFIREGRPAVEPAGRPAAHGWPRWAAAAAACVALIAVSGWALSRGEVTRLQADNAELRRQAEAAARRQPWAGVHTIDLFAEERRERSGSETGVTRLSAAHDMVLLLNPPAGGGCLRCEVAMEDAGGKVIWRASGVGRNPTGEIAVALPGGFLVPGSFVIQVKGEDKGPERYRLVVGRE